MTSTPQDSPDAENRDEDECSSFVWGRFMTVVAVVGFDLLIGAIALPGLLIAALVTTFCSGGH